MRNFKIELLKALSDDLNSSWACNTRYDGKLSKRISDKTQKIKKKL